MRIALLKANAPGVPFIYKLINWCSGNDGYGHAELWFDDGTGLSSHTGQGAAIQPPACGVVDWITFDIGRAADEPAIKAWGRGEIGPGYDYFGVARFVLPFMPAATKKWFCSEITVAACQRLGMFSGVQPSRISPDKLYEMCVGIGLKPQ